MNEDRCKFIIEQFAEKTAGRAFRLSSLWANDHERRECHPERSEPPG